MSHSTRNFNGVEDKILVRLWEDVGYDDDDVMIIVLARRVRLVQDLHLPKVQQLSGSHSVFSSITFSMGDGRYSKDIIFNFFSIGAQCFITLLDFYDVHLDMAALDVECGIMVGPQPTNGAPQRIL